MDRMLFAASQPVVTNSSVECLCDTLYNAFTKTTKMREDVDLNCHLIFTCDSWLAIFLRYKDLKQADNCFSAPVRMVLLSHHRTCGELLQAMNISVPTTQEMVSIEFSTSIWCARVVTHVQSNPSASQQNAWQWCRRAEVIHSESENWG